jgi:hypothetical protein
MNRSHTSLAAKWEAKSRTPFPLLVRLFMKRIFHGSNAGEDELNLSMGLVLALLAIPGGFISLFLFDKYGSLLRWLRHQPSFDLLAAAMPDEYFFIVLSMTVTGGVALWWWDSIFPDRRDFANLVHLPIPTRRIFLGNALALVLLAGLFTVDVNGASCILFPAVVGAAQPTLSFVVRFGAVHALAVGLASMFSFFAVFGVVGMLLVILPYAFFRKISLYIRSLLVTLLLATLSTSFAVPHAIANLSAKHRSPLEFFPPVWFLSFCQSLRGRANPVMAGLAPTAVIALAAAFVISLVAYTLSYRRCFSRLPEIADAPPGNLGTTTAGIFHLLDASILRTVFQKSGYRFVMKTLLRNEMHALTFGGFSGLGVVFASLALFSAFDGKGLRPLPSPELLSIPLILSYCLLFGIRSVFDVPANLPANWIFRFLLNNNGNESTALARRVMLSFVLPWIFLAVFPGYLHFWGWKVASFHTVLVAAWSMLLTEILLSRFRKLPFTCTYPPFQYSTVVNVIIYTSGFLVFVGLTSELEGAALVNPRDGVVLFLIGIGVWIVVRHLRRGVIAIDRELIFEDIPSSGFEFLHLADGN